MHRLLCLILALAGIAWPQKPVIYPGGIVNAASYTATPNSGGEVDGVSAGAIASIFGTNLAAVTEVALTTPLPTQLAGTSVLVRGVAAPLFYVSPELINFQLPYQCPAAGCPSLPFNIVVTTPAGASETYLLNTAGGEGLFTRDASGCGPGVVLNINADGTLTENSRLNSVSPGGEIVVYGTGLGTVINAPPDGVPAPNSPLSKAAIGGGPYFEFEEAFQPINVFWAGRAPGLIGVDQFNFLVPDTVREGCAVPLTVAAFYGISQPVTISVRRGGGPCVDPPAAGYGQISWERTWTTLPLQPASETNLVTVSLQAAPGKQIPAPPSPNPSAYEYFGPACPVPGYRSLDAGQVKVHAPGFDASTTMVPLQQGQVSGLTVYQAALPTGAIQAGSFSVSASSGADVGEFQSALPIGQPIQITSALAGRVISRSGTLTINWTGGDPNSIVTAKLVRHLGYADWSTNTVRASASSGALNLSGFRISDGDVELVVEQTPGSSETVSFSAPGLSLGGQNTWKYSFQFEGLKLVSP